MTTPTSFALHSLGWRDFEDLCATVCRVVMGQLVETFLPSRDGGRDAAFLGRWSPTDGAPVEGRFVIQCKHSALPNTHLAPSRLIEEVRKAQELAASGLCDHYFLMTNMSVTGASAGQIEQMFRAVPGVRSARVLEHTWLNAQIRAHSNLRMLVPRLYGLGDLTQILDERRYQQAHAILETYRHDLSTFVLTKSFQDAVRAIERSGFVVLLGAPATGKSIIAASLALGSIDRWKCNPIKAVGAAEFQDHWNPNEPT